MKYLQALLSALDYYPQTLMHHNLWFYNFIRVLPTFRTLKDPTMLAEIEITLQIGNKISATGVGFDDETLTWELS
jgi:hypothetical protein